MQLDAQWKDKQDGLHAALQKDIERMAKLNDMLRKVSRMVNGNKQAEFLMVLSKATEPQ